MNLWNIVPIEIYKIFLAYFIKCKTFSKSPKGDYKKKKGWSFRFYKIFINIL